MVTDELEGRAIPKPKKKRQLPWRSSRKYWCSMEVFRRHALTCLLASQAWGCGMWEGVIWTHWSFTCHFANLLVSSGCRAWDSLSQDCWFEPHVERENVNLFSDVESFMYFFFCSAGSQFEIQDRGQRKQELAGPELADEVERVIRWTWGVDWRSLESLNLTVANSSHKNFSLNW